MSFRHAAPKNFRIFIQDVKLINSLYATTSMIKVRTCMILQVTLPVAMEPEESLSMETNLRTRTSL